MLVAFYGPVLVLFYVFKYLGLGLWALGRLIVAGVLALPFVQEWRTERATSHAIQAIRDLAESASRDMDRLARLAGRR